MRKWSYEVAGEKQAAETKLEDLWRTVGRQTVKLALLQDNTGHLDSSWMNAYHARDYRKLIALMDESAARNTFHNLTSAAYARGVIIRRVQIVDIDNLTPAAEASLQVLMTYWGLENTLKGKEEVYLLSKEVCTANRITLPSTDTAVFDSEGIADTISTHYGPHSIASRDWHHYEAADAGPDDPYVQSQLELAAHITALLPLAHQVTPLEQEELAGLTARASLYSLLA